MLFILDTMKKSLAYTGSSKLEVGHRSRPIWVGNNTVVLRNHRLRRLVTVPATFSAASWLDKADKGLLD